jgi:transposase
MSTLRYQKRGDKYYVYEVTQYWDKELKKPRQKTKYLGTAEESNGEYKKIGRPEAAPKPEKAILDFGDSFAINEIAKNIGLIDIIKNSFDDLADSVMQLACFQICEGSAMQNCEDWNEGNIAHKLFPNAFIKSQDISRVISELGKQSVQQKFFKNYIAQFFPNKTGILIDSTALPSAINASMNTFGYTADGIQENVSCLMLVDKVKKLPIYFRAYGGDICDNATLKTTINEIKQLGLSVDSAILDAGYCSKQNLEYMCKEEVNFVTRLPKSHTIFFELVDGSALTQSLAHAVKYRDRTVFIVSKKLNIYGNEMYAHIILDTSKKAKDMNNILKNALDGKQTEESTATIDKKIKYSGYFILLSKSEIERNEVLPTYYTRQAIEQIFGFAKSNHVLLPLRVHSEQSINGYLMLVFIALILFITMRQKLQPKISIDKALLCLRSLKAKIYENEIIVQEPNKKSKDIAKSLKIIMPTTLGV